MGSKKLWSSVGVLLFVLAAAPRTFAQNPPSKSRELGGFQLVLLAARTMPAGAVENVSVVQLGTALTQMGGGAAHASAEVALQVAQKLDASQLEAARRQISQALGRDAVLHQYVDENIIGGAIIRVGDKLIDASVRYQLAAMKKQLLESAPK